MDRHHSYGKQQLNDFTCFLCGSELDNVGSVEHVFPLWLQNEFHIQTNTLHLLNGTSIQYKNLVIPCCIKCNSKYLSAIENEISSAVRAGYDAAIKVPQKKWYLWAGKIFYGILRKELSLEMDRRSPGKGTIATEDTLRSFSNLHTFLQGVRGRHQFKGEAPYTVLVCNLHNTKNIFDFRDDLIQFTLALRMGEVGVIVSFEDGGLIRNSYARYVQAVEGRKLHPIQFTELYAKVCYQVSLRQRPLTFLTNFHVDGTAIASTTMISASTPLNKWDQEEFAEILRFHLRHWMNDKTQVEYHPPDQLTTWMVGQNGEPLILPLEKWEST